MKTIGDVLRKRRFERGLKLRKLAAILQISSNRVSAWEHDEATPSAEEWMKLAKVLGLTAAPPGIHPNS